MESEWRQNPLMSDIFSSSTILNRVMNYVDVFLLAEACAFPRRLPYSAPVPLILPWVQGAVLSSLSESLPTNLAAAAESPAAVP